MLARDKHPSLLGTLVSYEEIEACDYCRRLRFSQQNNVRKLLVRRFVNTNPDVDKHKQAVIKKNFETFLKPFKIGLYHPLYGITNPKHKLMCFLTTNFLQSDEGTSF